MQNSTINEGHWWQPLAGKCLHSLFLLDERQSLVAPYRVASEGFIPSPDLSLLQKRDDKDSLQRSQRNQGLGVQLKKISVISKQAYFHVTRIDVILGVM